MNVNVSWDRKGSVACRWGLFHLMTRFLESEHEAIQFSLFSSNSLVLHTES